MLRCVKVEKGFVKSVAISGCARIRGQGTRLPPESSKRRIAGELRIEVDDKHT